eukprot:1442882-Rhodomonas_salina.2
MSAILEPRGQVQGEKWRLEQPPSHRGLLVPNPRRDVSWIPTEAPNRVRPHPPAGQEYRADLHLGFVLPDN